MAGASYRIPQNKWGAVGYQPARIEWHDSTIGDKVVGCESWFAANKPEYGLKFSIAI